MLRKESIGKNALKPSEEFSSLTDWMCTFIPDLARALVNPNRAIDDEGRHSTENIRNQHFDIPDSPANIRVHSVDGRITAISRTKMIAKLTSVSPPDMAFVTMFVGTFHFYLRPVELLELLSIRYDMPPGTPQQTADTIKLRVWFILKEWTTGLMASDFSTNKRFAFKASALVDKMIADPSPSISQAGKDLKSTMSKALTSTKLLETVRIQAAPPKAHLPPENIRSISDIHPVELARQLALMNEALLEELSPHELVDMEWARGAMRQEGAVVLTKFIKNFDAVRQWITCVVLDFPVGKDKERQKVISHLLSVAENSRDLGDFQSMCAIVAALSSQPISRLTTTWNEKRKGRLDKLVSLCEDNFAKMRKIIHETTEQCVPFIGIVLADFLLVDKFEPNRLPDNTNLMNLNKSWKVSSLLKRISHLQNMQYDLTPLLSVQSWIRTSMESNKITFERAMGRSKEIQPK